MPQAPRVTVIGGAPGSGKTSLARLLAAAHPNGVHIETDSFFRSLAHRIDPSLPEAQRQNETVIRAYAAAARAYADGGFRVFLDGVIGPWALPLIAASVPRFEYVILHGPLALLLARTGARTDQPSATPDLVAHMHAQFDAVQGEWARHVIAIEGRSLDALAGQCRAGGHDRLFDGG